VVTDIRAKRSTRGNTRRDPTLPDGTRLGDEAARRVEAWLLHDRRRREVFAPSGQAEAVEEAGGGRFEYAYDRRGDLTRIVEANGRRTAFEYDGSRRLARVAHPDGTYTGYAYANDRLLSVANRGVVRRFEYDAAGRVARIRHGNAGASVYRYDTQGRVVEARTSTVSTVHTYHPDGRVAAIRQSHEGIAIELCLEYDAAGRLAEFRLPGDGPPIRYTWDEKGRPHTVALGEEPLARFEYLDGTASSRVHLRNGVVEETEADPVDRRPVLRLIRTDSEFLFERAHAYGPEGFPASDGVRRYEYDALDRLIGVEEAGQRWRYLYDAQDNRVGADEPGGRHSYRYDADNRLVEVAGKDSCRISYDDFGRPVRKDSPEGQWTYRYNDAGQLLEARRRGDVVARFTYDHKGRLAATRAAGRSERYLYGPDDQLVAVTDEKGHPLRLYVWTPLGLLAEIHGSAGTSSVAFHHQDHRGTRHLVTGEDGRVAARWEYDPFGLPSGPSQPYLPMFGGRVWYPEVGLYYFGARWYDPRLGRFLTPDTYTGRPDDERLVHPCRPAGSQAFARSQILADWLKQPRVRNRYAFCGNDPVGRIDPNGHWSFGWTLLSVLGAIWTLPNTLFGLLLEITCLVGEVLRWLVWLVSIGNVSWETPGFDVAASGRLNAFALVFKGGWLGSFESLLGITFGNVFFVYGKWDEDPHYSGPGEVYPPAYDGKVAIPKNEALYEHELRHTNQYAWFGPFFHLGLPIFGVYVWDVILHGYQDAWLERDARDHAGLDHETPLPTEEPSDTTTPPAGDEAPLPPPTESLTFEGKAIDKVSRNPVANARVDACGTQLRLTMKLRTFEKPDTSSKQTGSLDEGDYRVFEILRNVSDADYVRVQSDKLPGGEGWVCSRSKDSHYALLYDSVEKEGATTTNAQGEFSVEVGEKRLHRLRFVIENYFDAESERLPPPRKDVEVELAAAPNSVKESYLIDRIDDFKNFSYNRDDGWYPYELPDVSIQQAPPRQNNCSTMVEGLAIKAWKDARGDAFTWSLAKHNRMMITSTDDYFSPVTETVASGLGIEIDADELPPPWTLVQGWKTQWTGGHNFFIVDVHPDTERILTLESNKAYEMDGPGFRMLGDIDNFKDFNPGKDWWKDAKLWTWDKFKETYAHRKMARLKVHDQKWVR
jgi:RHS repeat-associated protein